ncbi:MAG: CatB-related O-acetyltransferase [Planctomycetes bacterium]|nr:CatB-related O-acetyltransferase [Planctomycetota bacterium]
MRTAPVLGPLILRLYRLPSWRLKQFLRWFTHKIEGGSIFSLTLREIFRRHHGIEVGDYTHGGWIHPWHLDEGTVVGRYCSIAESVRTVTHNHPLNTKSTSGLFFNPLLGFVDRNPVQATQLVIGNDVWLGHNAVVLPSVQSIGDGAVIGAGTVVARDVPPYAIVQGNPGRVIGYRFSPAKIAELLASRWWERSLDELQGDVELLTPIEDAAAQRGGG